MQHWIIDGYNLLREIPGLNGLRAHDAENAREQLLNSIAALAAKKKIRCTVVFDGTAPDRHRPPLRAPLHVVYSSPLTAEEKIKKMVDTSATPTQLTVISSDREMLAHARTRSCETHSSKHVSNLLRDEGDVPEKKTDQPLSDAQVRQWLKIFGER